MRRRRVPAGVLPVAKPPGPTSRDVVNAVMRVLGTRRVGHAGTLDPFAEGVVVTAWDRATSLLPFLQEHPKSYVAVVLFGTVTDTLDTTGAVLRSADAGGLDEESVRAALGPFRGSILQRPPMYSALKQGGRRLHELARAGEEVERPLRERTVHRLELTGWDPPRARLEVTCSAGTYVRTLAHDLGERLGPGACVETLVRTAVGPHRLDRAVPLAAIADMDREALLRASLDPAGALPDWPAVAVPDADEAREIVHGSWRDPAGRIRDAGRCRLLDAGGRLLALAEGGGTPRLLRVLAGEGDP